MIFRRITRIETMPPNCSECPISPKKLVNECELPLDGKGYWIKGCDKKRHKLCPLVESVMSLTNYMKQTKNNKI